MAFVCKSEKPSFLPQRDTVPGPGSYPVTTNLKSATGYAPFLSTTQRSEKQKRNPPKLPPGPGAYNLPSSFQAAERNNKVCYSTLSRNSPGIVENANLTTNFRSRVQRFESLERDDVPGPGAYENKQAISRRFSANPIAAQSHSNVIVDKIIEQSRKGVASIPSHVNKYGYSEDPNRNLVANQNPLFELQKYVGPGYYQPQELFPANKSRGLSWDRSNTRRFEGSDSKKGTNDRIGPGCYEIEGRVVPSYQNKATSAFASKIEREAKKEQNKKRSGSVPPKRANSMLSDPLPNDHSYIFADQFKEEIEELEAMQEMANIGPGPGQYHNDRITSSIRTSYKPPRLQFFGSSTERFPMKEPTATTIGPGEYQDKNKSAQSKKEKKNIPFSVSKPRFEKGAHEYVPGPGTYDGKKTILDRVRDKERSGYIGSFGMTDKRFKDVQNILKTPDPGQYHAQTEGSAVEEKSDFATTQKPGQAFQSKVPRDVNKLKKDKIPPPGTYNLGYYDISKKISKEASNENRPPFNMASARFKASKQPEQPVNEEEDDLFGSPRIRSLSCPAQKKPKMNAVFISQTRKNYEAFVVNNNMPGPGYYAKSTVPSWIKKTHNVNFIHD